MVNHKKLLVTNFKNAGQFQTQKLMIELK
jgi:hypothetical protein